MKECYFGAGARIHGGQASEFVGAPGELQSRPVGRVYSLGVGNSCKDVLKFVRETKGNNIMPMAFQKTRGSRSSSWGRLRKLA